MFCYPYTRVADEPMAPYVNINIFSPDDENGTQGVPCTALMDTGASITLVPSDLLTQELKLLPFTLEREVRGLSGSRLYLPYGVIIEFNHGKHETQVLGWDKDFALIGRDLLNIYSIKFDGPRRGFEFLT